MKINNEKLCCDPCSTYLHIRIFTSYILLKVLASLNHLVKQWIKDLSIEKNMPPTLANTVSSNNYSFTEVLIVTHIIKCRPIYFILYILQVGGHVYTFGSYRLGVHNKVRSTTFRRINGYYNLHTRYLSCVLYLFIINTLTLCHFGRVQILMRYVLYHVTYTEKIISIHSMRFCRHSRRLLN